ncbi:unnamed protein product, partial [Ectocarpus sp. 8 AP-2014]
KAERESAFGALVGGVWDKRVPRDSDGCIVLDESPTCLKHIIHTLLNSCVTTSFGESIAGLLMEEFMALAYARVELEEAAARARTAARALCVIYGPYVARGEEDPVVGLNVRGRSITTLYSTLHACPDSVFAAWFAERWSGGKGVDEDGRYKVNCDPSCFSKILDVMCMRKQAGWAEDDDIVKNAGGGDTIRVRVSEADRENFEDAVKMYFPNCAGFIMDLVGFTG